MSDMTTRATIERDPFFVNVHVPGLGVALYQDHDTPPYLCLGVFPERADADPTTRARLREAANAALGLVMSEVS